MHTAAAKLVEKRLDRIECALRPEEVKGRTRPLIGPSPIFPGRSLGPKLDAAVASLKEMSQRSSDDALMCSKFLRSLLTYEDNPGLMFAFLEVASAQNMPRLASILDRDDFRKATEAYRAIPPQQSYLLFTGYHANGQAVVGLGLVPSILDALKNEGTPVGAFHQNKLELKIGIMGSAEYAQLVRKLSHEIESMNHERLSSTEEGLVLLCANYQDLDQVRRVSEIISPEVLRKMKFEGTDVWGSQRLLEVTAQALRD